MSFCGYADVEPPFDKILNAVCLCSIFKKEKKQLSNIFWKVKDIQVFDMHVKSRDVFRKIHFYIVLIILKKK